MPPFKEISTTRLKSGNTKLEEFLKIRITKHQKRIVSGLRILTFRDKDTRQIVKYIPSLDISGYGSTGKKASEMLTFSLDEYFKYLTGLSQDKVAIELRSLGWRRDRVHTKEYSKSFVDTDGNLKNLNAVGDKVEESMLTT